MSIEELFRDLYTNNGEEIAFAFEENMKVRNISFREFIEDVYIDMKKISNLKNQSIALIANNSYSWIRCYFSIILSGNIAVLMDPEVSDEKINYMIKDSGCSYVYLENNETLVSKINSKNSWSENIKGLLFGNITETCDEKDNKKKEYNIIIYTSGSSGVPKGVMLSSDGILRNAVSVCNRIQFEDGLFLTLPLHHAYAMTVGLFAMFCCKNWIYIGKKQFDLEEVKTSGAKAILTVPAIVEFIQRKMASIGVKATNGDGVKENFSASIVIGELHQIMCGGASLKEESELFFFKNKLDLITGYGMTECGTVISAENTKLKKFGSVGKILDCYEVKIENQNEDGLGEILVRGASLMKGYLNDSKKMASDEFFATGDIGMIDEEGFLYIQGRTKNQIVFNNGKKIVPEELEKHIKKINHVDDAIISLYKGKNVEYVVVVIEIDDESTKNKTEVYDAIMKLNETLPFYMRIEKIIFSENDIEKTSLNKVRRSEVQKFVDKKLIPINLLKILENVSGISSDEISIRDNLVTDLGIDSLGMYSLLIGLENEPSINRHINIESFKMFKTVADIVENCF